MIHQKSGAFTKLNENGTDSLKNCVNLEEINNGDKLINGISIVKSGDPKSCEKLSDVEDDVVMKNEGSKAEELSDKKDTTL